MASKKKIKTLIIDRRTWLRGESGNSRLLRKLDNKRCCLGFLGRACGLTDKEMVNMATPLDTFKFMDDANEPNKVKISKKWVKWILSDHVDHMNDGLPANNSSATADLMTINDDGYMTEQTREDKVKEVFARHDIKVIFRN